METVYVTHMPKHVEGMKEFNIVYTINAFSWLYKLTFKLRIQSHLPFAGIIRISPYSPR